MEAGEPHGITPLGLDALDMVRIEAGLVFGGHDFDSTTDPFEAGIGFTVPTKKDEDFIGKAALERRRANPNAQARRPGDCRQRDGRPRRSDLRRPRPRRRGHQRHALADLEKDDRARTPRRRQAAPGTELEIGNLDGQQKRLAATVVRFPFYDPTKSRMRV